MTRSKLAFLLVACALAAGSYVLINDRLDSVAYAGEDDREVTEDLTPTFSHRVQPGETLYTLARTYYDDAALWQLIADANAFANASDLKAGMTLRIPQIDGFMEPEARQNALRAEVLSTSAKGGWQAMMIGAHNTGAEVNAAAPVFARVAANTDAASDSRVEIVESTADGYRTLFESKVPASAGTFRYAFVDDSDGDGVQEFHTVWQQGDDPYVRRIFARDEGGIALVRIAPADPFVVAWEMQNQVPAMNAG